MSVEAISWALNLAPVPGDRGGQPCSACKFVLVGLANHADPDGAAAFPSVATLVRYTGLSERTVRTRLDRLEAGGIIRPCDPGIVAARIRRADRRPKGWELDLTQIRGDLTQTEVAALGRSPPAWPPGSPRPTSPMTVRPGGVQSLHPRGLWITRLTRCSRCAPHPGRGAISASTGGNQHSHGGAAVAPEPSVEPCLEPPAATARAGEAEPRRGGAAGGGPPGEFFAALG